jgi:hypothetical protein
MPLITAAATKTIRPYRRAPSAANTVPAINTMIAVQRAKTMRLSKAALTIALREMTNFASHAEHKIGEKIEDRTFDFKLMLVALQDGQPNITSLSSLQKVSYMRTHGQATLWEEAVNLVGRLADPARPLQPAALSTPRTPGPRPTPNKVCPLGIYLLIKRKSPRRPSQGCTLHRRS